MGFVQEKPSGWGGYSWIMPEVMTLNDVTTVILHYFTEFGSLEAKITSQWLKFYPNCLHQKCSPKNLVFDNILLMVIFSEITEKGCIKESNPHVVSQCQQLIPSDIVQIRQQPGTRHLQENTINTR